MIPNSGSPSPTLEQEIKHEARRLGFVLAGVTTPEPPPHITVFENWLSLDRHGQMGYLGTERSRLCRSDPHRILPECRSILVLAMPYSNPAWGPTSHSHPSPRRSRGKVAAYAWGRDYHDVIPERVKVLVAFIERRESRAVLSRYYTDTGPVLERELAQRAGLGWIGKNTCLISPKLGSYFLLAELLLDLELQPDAAFETDHCGSCTRCIQACPTSCILPDRTIDAPGCISYLTIELRGAIPLELRTKTDDWIFGCDICQMVCPWNRFAPPYGDAEFAGDPSTRAPNLDEQLQLSAEEFTQRARGLPLKRTKHSGALRNAAVAAGNTGGPEVLQSLRALAEMADPMISEHAAWALARIAEREASDA